MIAHLAGRRAARTLVAGTVRVMCCGTFANINNGTRDRFGVHSERERKWSPLWTTLVGVRGEIVSTNTGDVQDREDREDDPAPGIHVSRFKSSHFSCRD